MQLTFGRDLLECAQEIYTQPYDEIKFGRHRNTVCDVDLYAPHHPLLNALNELLTMYESCGSFPPVRRAALRRVEKLVVWEDENTGYGDIAPVSKMFQLVCRYVMDGADASAPGFARHLTRIDDFLWLSKEGLMMCGTNGSQLWDAAFIAQALVETGLAEREENKASVKGLLDWLDKAQIQEDVPYLKEDYRHTTKGAWPFSTPEQGYTASAVGRKGEQRLMRLVYACRSATALRRA